MKNYILFVCSVFILNMAAAQNADYEKAKEYLKAEKYKLALSLLNGIDGEKFGRSEYFTYKSTCYFALGDVSEGLSTLGEGIRLMPDSGDLYEVRGYYLNLVGEHKAAARDYTMALEYEDSAKKRSLLLANLGGIKHKLRDFEGAHKVCTEAVALDSTNLAAWNNLAITCDEMGLKNDAQIALDKIMSIDSTYVAAFVNLGFKYQGEGDHLKAIEYFDKVVEINDKEPLAYSNRSYSRLKLGDLKGAMKDINRSIDLYSVNSYAYWVRAQIHLEKGNKKEACEDLSMALALGYTRQFGSAVEDLVKEHCSR